MKLLITGLLAVGIAMAGSVDGKWVSERKMERDGQSFTIVQTFDLKSEGTKLGGNLTVQFGEMEPRTITITDGKVDGDNFSFKTTLQTPNGDFVILYTGKVEGDTLKGTTEREGGGTARPFEAKKK